MKPFFIHAATALLLLAGVLSLGVVIYVSSALIDDISRKEALSARMLIRTTMLVSQNDDPSMSDVYSLAGEIISSNDFLPVILVDSNDSICSVRNLPKPDSLLSYADKQAILDNLRSNGDSAVVNLGDERQVVYFGQSTLLGQLGYIRWLQILAALLFAVVVYALLSRARRRERNSIWKGLALETAHQLGTPITALSAWCELLENGLADNAMVAAEMQKDIVRLKAVSERFSKVGSLPHLVRSGLSDELKEVGEYLGSRISARVSLYVRTPEGDIEAPHDATLIKWVVENICRNAADAIEGKGSIMVSLSRIGHFAAIDVADTGKGMDASTKRKIFDVGFSTKTRGWGIGLALVRRIVEQYHHGRVFVLHSQLGKGTTFRILLPLE